MDKIIEAIHEWLDSEIFPGEGRILSGAVIAYETSRMEDDNIFQSVQYASLMDGSMVRDIGLLDVAKDRMMFDLIRDMNSEE